MYIDFSNTLLLSDSTANVDRTLKRDLYAERFHTSEYFYFSPETLEFAGFRLDMNQYKSITPNAQGWMWSEMLGLFLGIHERQLRYFSLEGALLATPQEAARNEIKKAEQERLKAEQERLIAEQERLNAKAQLNRAEQSEARLQELQEKCDRSVFPMSSSAHLSSLAHSFR